MFDSEFSDVYGRAAASALRDVIDVSPKTFKKSGFDNDFIHCYEEEFTSPLCHLSVTSGRNCVELIPRGRWVAASRGQPVFDTWIPVGAGGGGYVCDWCSPDDTLVWFGDSDLNMNINSFDHASGLMDCIDLLCDMGESVVSSVRDCPLVFHQHCLQPKLSNTEILEVAGVLFDVCDIGLFSAAYLECFGAASVLSNVTGDGDEIPMTTVARLRGGGSGCSGWLKFVLHGAGPVAPPISERSYTVGCFQNGGMVSV